MIAAQPGLAVQEGKSAGKGIRRCLLILGQAPSAILPDASANMFDLFAELLACSPFFMLVIGFESFFAGWLIANL
jgi:hypothetical protein